MLIGAMNHPAKDVLEEIRWIAEMGLEFVDLTLEPPMAASWNVEPRAIRAALDEYKLEAVGHTAFYLPLASPIEEVRRGAVEELKRCLRVFSEVGVMWMNVHPEKHAPMHDRVFTVRQNIRTLEDLLSTAQETGVGIMIENVPGEWNSATQLGEILDVLPEISLHLDIGHCNLQTLHNTTEEILHAYGERLRHVHIHDNKGGVADLHLPLGCGTLDLAREVCALRGCGYDGTITLEVFTSDDHYLAYSRDLLRKTWTECPPRPRA